MTVRIFNHLPPAAGTTNRGRFVAFIFGIAVLLAVYWSTILALSRYAAETDYQQHILFVPLITVFLIWRRGQESKEFLIARSSWLAGIFGTLCGITIALIQGEMQLAAAITPHDALSLSVLSLLVLVLANALMTMGWYVIRPHLFAVCFLLFATPLPDRLVHVSSAVLQHASADAAQLMLTLAGTPVSRNGLLFHIRGLDFLVAEECSGFRATIVLFIVSLLAAHLLLKQRPYKIFLVASVLPIAIVRNGFRITLITWLTTHVSSHIIDSPLHHHGGPLFFILGLLPFLALLSWLRRKELLSSKKDLSAKEAAA